MEQTSTILIVDDDSGARAALEGVLLGQGYRLAFASDGSSALAQAAELTPDLILLDVMMPGMDGFDVCRRLRADARLSTAPIILITALDDRASRVQGIEAGADDFVSKPFDRVELRARVRTVTRLNRYRRLLAERARFEWVVEQADEGYLMLDACGVVLYANPSARRYLGLPAEPNHHPEDSQPASMTFLALARRRYRCEPEAAWSTWPEAPEAQAPRYLVRLATQEAPAFWLQVDVLESSAGAPEHALVRLRDITASMIERGATWKFHALVNHKLRTPLSGLTGFLQIVDDHFWRLPEQEKKDFIGSAHASARKLQERIESIFQYLEAPNLARSQRDRYNLAGLVQLVEGISQQLELEAPTVTYERIDNPATIWLALSRPALELIAWELLENAKKFHPRHAPTLEITVADTPTGPRLRVCDDGRTLAPDRLARLGAPYYQLERHFTGEVAGMGLGLAMVTALLWEVGGSCQISNRSPGPGIVVELVVPLADPA